MDQLPADREILALVPEYTDFGNAVRLYLADGREVLIAGTLRAVLRALARRRCKDLGLLRAYAARYTQRRFANPLAVSPDLVLAPLRTREPKIPGDPTQGLVNVAAPIRLAAPEEAPPVRPAIELPGGRRIPLGWTAATVRRHLADARSLHADLVREQQESLLRRLAAPSS